MYEGQKFWFTLLLSLVTQQISITPKGVYIHIVILLGLITQCIIKCANQGIITNRTYTHISLSVVNLPSVASVLTSSPDPNTVGHYAIRTSYVYSFRFNMIIEEEICNVAYLTIS